MTKKNQLSQLQRVVITASQRQDQQILLTHEQQHYLVRVLRLGSGDRFIAMDGKGSWWLCEFATNLAQARIVESLSVETELPLSITLIVAMPKGSGFEQVIQQATELGVSRILPIKSARTLLDPSPRKLERWRRIILEAAEQSERQVVPILLNPVDFAASLESITTETHNYICVARGDLPHLLDCLRKADPNIHTSTPYIVIATGPEGGWTPLEIEQALAAGFQPVSLGCRILRAVTAPVVALSIVAAVVESNLE